MRSLENQLRERNSKWQWRRWAAWDGRHTLGPLDKLQRRKGVNAPSREKSCLWTWGTWIADFLYAPCWDLKSVTQWLWLCFHVCDKGVKLRFDEMMPDALRLPTQYSFSSWSGHFLCWVPTLKTYLFPLSRQLWLGKSKGFWDCIS